MNLKSWRPIVFLVAAILLFVVLGMSLSRMTLSEGYTIPLKDVESISTSSMDTDIRSDVVVIVLRGFVAVAIILLPIYIVYSIFTPEGRKRLLADVILIILLLGLARLVENYQQEEVELVETEQELGAGAPFDFTVEGFSGEPLPELPDEAPQWLTGLVIMAIGGLAAVGVGFAVWFFRKNKQPAESSLDQLAEEAQTAIKTIQSGGDLQAVILRSYAEMNRMVKEELGFARNRAMTARDFEDYLDSKGLPAVPLRTLTRLFEQARYGSFAPGKEEENAAISCLTELIEAIQALKGDE